MIKEIEIDKLILRDSDIDPTTFNTLKKSILKIGLIIPIMVEYKKRKFVVFDGFYRVKVMKELGYSIVKADVYVDSEFGLIKSEKDLIVLEKKMVKIRKTFEEIKS